MLIIFTQLSDQQTYIQILGSHYLQNTIPNAFEGPFIAECERLAAAIESENVNRLFAFGLWVSFRVVARS